MIALVLVSFRVASATPAAEKLFDDGRAALALEHYDEACDLFRRSQELEPRVGTLLNLGDCETHRNHLASAWGAFVEARTLAITLKDSKRQATADRLAAALAPRLPYLRLAVKRVEGLVISRDGVVVPAAEWDREVPLDPKHYKLAATAPGHVAWSQEIDLAEKQHLTIDVPELAAVAVVDKPVDKPADKPNDQPPPRVMIDPVKVTTTTTEQPFAYHIGLGPFLSLSNGADAGFGVHVVANAAPLSFGWIRAVPFFRRWTGRFEPPFDGRTYDTYSFGATVEFAAPVNRNIFIAAGAGLGIEYQADSDHPAPMYSRDVFYVPAIRVSPTLHYDRFDVSLSYQLEFGPATPGRNDSNTDTSGQRYLQFSHRFEAAVDFFVW